MGSGQVDQNGYDISSIFEGAKGDEFFEELARMKSKATGGTNGADDLGEPTDEAIFNAVSSFDVLKRMKSGTTTTQEAPTTPDTSQPKPDMMFGRDGTAVPTGDMPEGSFRDKYGWTHNPDGTIKGFPEGCYVDEKGCLRNEDDSYFHTEFNDAPAAPEAPKGFEIPETLTDEFGNPVDEDGELILYPKGYYVDDDGVIRRPDGSEASPLDIQEPQMPEEMPTPMSADSPESTRASQPDADDDTVPVEFDVPEMGTGEQSAPETPQKPVPDPNKTIEELRREIEEFKRMNAELQRQMMTAQQFAKQAAQEHADVRRKTMETEQPQERLTFEEHTAEFNGQPFKYMNYEERFTKKPSDVERLTKENAMVKLSVLLIKDIEDKFGGLANITDVAVISGMILLNSVRYAPMIPEEWLQYAPISERNAISAGHLAKLFDFELLFDGNMPNVVNLLIDSESFAFTYVKPRRVRNLSEKTYFEKISSLVTLQIGSTVYTRDCLQKPSKAFVIQQRAEEIRKKIDTGFCDFTFNRWDDFWDIVKDSDRGGWERAGLGALNLVGAAAGGAGAVITKGTGILGKAASGIGSFFKTLKENM